MTFPAGAASGGSLEDLLTRLEALLAEIQELDEPVRAPVFELMDGFDFIHRTGFSALGEALDRQTLERLRAAHPAIAWMFDAYGVGRDEQAEADAALESIRPYIHSHGGKVEVLDARGGVVRLRLSGSCSGCTASAVTLQHGIDEALREKLPGFVATEVEEDHAEPHPPPGPVILELPQYPG